MKRFGGDWCSLCNHRFLGTIDHHLDINCSVVSTQGFNKPVFRECLINRGLVMHRGLIAVSQGSEWAEVLEECKVPVSYELWDQSGRRPCCPAWAYALLHLFDGYNKAETLRLTLQFAALSEKALSLVATLWHTWQEPHEKIAAYIVFCSNEITDPVFGPVSFGPQKRWAKNEQGYFAKEVIGYVLSPRAYELAGVQP